MKIVKFDNKYLNQIANLLIKEFSDEQRIWGIKQAKQAILNDLKACPDYCYMALSDDDKCMAAIFCTVHPIYKGDYLSINALLVKNDFRQQGVGKALLKKVVDLAKKKKLAGLYLLADIRKEFPQSWYMKMGFRPTGWAEFAIVDINDVKI